MTFSSPQIIRAKAEASLEQAQTAFWFPVLPGLQALPATPTIIANPIPSPANAVAVPVGFNEDNPDLADLFANILPKGVAPVFPRTMEPAAALVVPPYNEIQTWEARIRVPAEAILLPFSNEIVYSSAITLKGQMPSFLGTTGASSQSLTITGTAAGLARITGTAFAALAITGTATGVRIAIQGSVATLSITGTASGRVRVTGTSSQTLVLTGSTAGVITTPSGSLVTLVITGTAAGTVRVTGASSQTLSLTGTAAGTVVAPGYRYWRMTSLALFNPANFLQLAEIQYATAADTANIVSRISDGASAATAYLGPDGGGAVANVNDDNTATDAAWGSSRWGDSLFHITIDMGSPREITHWRQRWTGVFGSGLSGLTVQASNTAGSGYVTIATLSGLSNPGADTWSGWQSLT